MPQEPTIRGVFVKSHIRALEKERGDQGMEQLRKRFNKSIEFGNTDNVPVRFEVELLEKIVEVLAGHALPDQERELEAGRLHFRNFTTTPMWAVVTSMFGTDPKPLLMQSSTIAGRVFHGVEFTSEDAGERSVKIVMRNNDYPIGHFQGFFEEWLKQSGVSGYVEAYKHTDNAYEYVIAWNEPHIKVEAH
jgi:uncharacterized protein (TIGR02265 family)